MQKTQWRSRTSSCQFGDLITADHKVLSDNCESRNNHRYAVVVQDLTTQWIQAYPCKKPNLTRSPEKLVQVPGTREETQSHLHWQFFGIRQSLWRSFLESLHVYTTSIGDQRYCRKSSAQSKGRDLCCIVIRVWMKVGGRILWNVTPICETSQIYCPTGRRRMTDVLGNHVKDRLFQLVHWLSITL